MLKPAQFLTKSVLILTLYSFCSEVSAAEEETDPPSKEASENSGGKGCGCGAPSES